MRAQASNNHILKTIISIKELTNLFQTTQFRQFCYKEPRKLRAHTRISHFSTPPTYRKPLEAQSHPRNFALLELPNCSKLVPRPKYQRTKQMIYCFRHNNSHTYMSYSGSNFVCQAVGKSGLEKIFAQKQPWLI